MSDTLPAHILVVDDEAPQLRALCETLGDAGFTATGFGLPREALEAMRRGRFDLLLTDLKMPDMDGIALLGAARELDPELVAIVMTGHGTVDTAVEAMRLGAFDYIRKPFKLGAVMPALTRALTFRRLRVENAALLRDLRSRTAQLEAANQELEAFSYSVAHDLRAPLRSVAGFASLLRDGFAASLPEEGQRFLGKVISSAGRMDGLIDDLLRLARVGRGSFLPRRVAMQDMIRELLDEVRESDGARAVEMTVGELPDAFGDAALLRQVFANLISNAFKFTRRRNPAVIEVGCNAEGGESVYFVRDNGAGFDMQYADRLFGAFQRMHRAEEFEGTGVGLSLAQRIVHRHGGRIWADATLDRGATFFVALPAGKEQSL